MFTRSRTLAAMTLVLATALPALAGQDPNQDLRNPPAHRQMAGPRRDQAADREVASARRDPGAEGHPGREIHPREPLRAALSVVADALFDFDKSSSPHRRRGDACAAAAPEIKKIGGKPSRVEGHTDAKGGDALQHEAPQARATTVRDWMAKHELLPASTPIKGYGKTVPAAPNTTADGRDDPVGRQKNRRVEVVFDTCT